MKCTKCGHTFSDSECGISITIPSTWRDLSYIKERMGKTNFSLCMVCFLKGLGFKEKWEQK